MNNPPLLPWCRLRNPQLVFRGRIREGQFGSYTDEPFEVWEYPEPRMAFLNPLPTIDYTDDSYRISINNSSTIESYLHLHGWEQSKLIAHFQHLLVAGISVMDVGCGGGALLDLVKAETGGRSIAVEPFVGYHRSLGERGHEVFGSMDEAKQTLQGGVDLAISSHVIEHVPDPISYLSEIRKLVKPGGTLFVLTPNLADVLMQIDPTRFAPFFYRQVHNYYFTSASLAWLANEAGWTVDREVYHHPFGMANALHWLRDGKPAGRLRLPGIVETADEWWREYLIGTRQTQDVGVILRNRI